MPIPTPNTGESRSEFMQRCTSLLVDEGYDQDQSVAICSQQWDDSKKISMIKTKRYESLNNNQLIAK